MARSGLATETSGCYGCCSGDGASRHLPGRRKAWEGARGLPAAGRGCRRLQEKERRRQGSSAATAMAAVRWHVRRRAVGARAVMGSAKGVNGSGGGASGVHQGERRGTVHAAWRWNAARAWLPRTGHASSVGAFPQTPGEQRIDHGGAQVWASYGPIWFMGPKQSLLYTACSTFLI